MPFDEKQYDLDVLKPLRARRSGLQPDEDLISRYAIGPECTDAARLKAHLKTIRSFWNQKSTGRDSRSQVCRMLIAADEQLRRTVGSDLDDPVWWQSAAQRGEQLARRTITQLAEDLAAGYGKGGQITRAQLAAIAGQFPTLSPAQIDEAARQAKLKTVDDIDLPTDSGLDRTSYRTLRARLAEVGASTIVNLLHPDLTKPFTLLPAFSVADEPQRALDEATLRAQITVSESGADSAVLRARKAALGVLRTGLAGGADLRTIVLFQIIEDLGEAKAQKVQDFLLVRRACKLGLTESDARLVVTSLPLGGEAGGAVAPGQRVRDLLESGELRAAQQALGALSATDPEHPDVRSLVDAAHVRVEKLVREAVAALDAHHEDEAVRLLDEAIRIAGDDDDLAVRRRLVPLGPPRETSAAEVNGTVRLAWSAPNVAGPGVRYRIVRTEDRQPTGPDDGRAVATTTDNRCTDADPPVATRLRYAVYASADGTSWSRADHAEALVTPPVTDVVMRVDENLVVASWKRHRSVVSVRVRRTVGRAPKNATEGNTITATADSFADQSIDTGKDYFYSLVAVYVNSRKQEIPAEMVIASATPRAPGTAVDGLTVEPISVNGSGSRVRIAWPTTLGTDVQLRYAKRRPLWDFGQAISLAQLATFGNEVIGTPVRHADDTIVEADVPAGQHVYVAFSIGGTGAIVGRPVAMGVIEPIRQLSARRIGSEAVLSWVWPNGVAMVELVWTTSEHGSQTRRITKAQYVDAGCRLPVGPSGGTARISAIAPGHVGEATSPPVRIAVEGRPLSVSYQIERASGFRKRLSRQRFVQVKADANCFGVDLIVIASDKLAMPLRPEHGQVVNRFEGLVLIADQSETFEVEIPDGLRRPYWLRCFVTAPENATVIDPPIDNLKVVR